MARPPKEEGGLWSLDPSDLETLDRLVTRGWMLLPEGGRFYNLMELIRAGYAVETGEIRSFGGGNRKHSRRRTSMKVGVKVVPTELGKEVALLRLRELGRALDDQVHNRRFIRQVKDENRKRRRGKT